MSSEDSTPVEIPENCLLGCHVSIAGGMQKAPQRARELGCTTAQIFVSSNRQWAVRELKEGEAGAFKDEEVELPGKIHAHATYLINLAKADPGMRERSISTVIAELNRCSELGISYLVLHPGSHVGKGEDVGIRHIREALDQVHQAVPSDGCQILLETMAGQGSVLPYTFEQLAEMREGLSDPHRIGYCFDTCHVHAAGYDLSGEKSYEETMVEMENTLGLEPVKLLHLNDSREACGSRKDRHQHIGEGTIGEEGFRCLMNDPRWATVPKVLETPVDDDWRADYGRNIERLVSYID